MTYEEESNRILQRAKEVDSEIDLLKTLYESIPRNDIMRDVKQSSIEHRLSILNREHERLMERFKASSQDRISMDRRERLNNIILWVIEHPVFCFSIFGFITFIIVFALGEL